MIMRRIIFALVTLLSVVTVSYAENAMYIYRNDGQFNAFLDSNVDSVVYSCVDTSGVTHQLPVTQLVYTPDSLYRIPLSAIDSVAMTDRLAPEFKADVYHLTAEHIPYIMNVDGLTLTFASNTPQSLLPGKGNVVVTDVFDAPLQAGFAGRAVDVSASSSGVVVSCEAVSITDVYERLICVGSVKSQRVSTEPSQIRAYSSGSVPFQFEPISKDFGPVTLSDTPEARIDYNVFIEPGYHPSVMLLMYHTHNLNAHYNYEKEGDDGDEVEIVKVPAKLPYGLFASVDYGAFWEAAGKMNLEVDVPYTIGFVNGFQWNENGFTSVNRKTQSKLGTPTADMELNGTITAGMFMRMHFGLLYEELLSVNTTLKSGLQLEADYSLSDYDLTTIGQSGTVYTLLKDAKIKLNNYLAWDCGYNIIGNDGEISIFGNPLSYERTENIKEWWLLPSFSNLTRREGSEKTTAIIETTPSRNLFMPVTLGIGLTDKSSGTNFGVQYNGVSYRLQNEYPLNSVSGVFSNLEYETRYVAYPVVNILGYELRSPQSIGIYMESKITPGQEVDLGLPSGTIWAGWNVGATSHDECGNYYTWGDTDALLDPDQVVRPDEYKYWTDKDGDGGYDKGEFENIGTDISGTQYDAARQEWGGLWRMPSKTDFDELVTYCKWTDGYSEVGVMGYKVTGPNGNAIFLPENPYWIDFMSFGYGKSYGDYWTATLYDDLYDERAWSISFRDILYNEFYHYSTRQNEGLIRPVKSRSGN